MTQKQTGDYHRTSRRLIWGVVVVSLVVILSGVAGIVKGIRGVKAPEKKSQVQQITLVKPPPPKVKEQPPEQKQEPELKKEEAKEIVAVEKPQDAERPMDNEPPPSADLGVDADASGSGDSFGLQARKGGASLVGGGGVGSGGSIYAWYGKRYGSEIQQLFDEIVNKRGGFKGASLKAATVRVDVDDSGAIRGTLLDSTGDPQIDEAVQLALSRVTLREPPPPGMPRALKFRIRLQG